jgi:tetratricopeptide (TPR) repeat protein
MPTGIWLWRERCAVQAQANEPPQPSAKPQSFSLAKRGRVTNWETTLSASGKYRKAITAYRAAVSLDPKSPYIRVALANTLWASGQITEAVENRALRPEGRAEERSGSETGRRRTIRTPLRSRHRAPQRGRCRRSMEPWQRPTRAVGKRTSSEPRNCSRRDCGSILPISPGGKYSAIYYLEKLDAPAKAVPHLAKVVEAAPRRSGVVADARKSAGAFQGFWRSHHVVPKGRRP